MSAPAGEVAARGQAQAGRMTWVQQVESPSSSLSLEQVCVDWELPCQSLHGHWYPGAPHTHPDHTENQGLLSALGLLQDCWGGLGGAVREGSHQGGLCYTLGSLG